MKRLHLVATVAAGSAYLGGAVSLRRGAAATEAELAASGTTSGNVSNTTNSTTAWYSIWGKEVAKDTGPKRQWKLESEDDGWRKRQTKRRARRMAPTGAYARELADRDQSGVGRGGDDSDDATWRSHAPVDDYSAFWTSLCNSTDQARLDAAGAEKAAEVAKKEAEDLTTSVASKEDAAVSAAKEAKTAKDALAEKTKARKEAETASAAAPNDDAATKAKEDAMAAESQAQTAYNAKAKALADADKVLGDAKAQSLCTSTNGKTTSGTYPCFCGPTRGPTCKRNEICTVNEKDSGASKCALKMPLDPYSVNRKTTCSSSDLMNDGESIKDELKAYEMCGAGCSAVLDVGCGRKEFKLCKIGAVYEDDKTSAPSCLRMRVPDHPPPEGKARPPIHLEFWKTFCGRSVEHQNRFRVLFSRRLCAAGKEIKDAWTDQKCAELVKQDAECSKVFDYQYTAGAPNVCRCVKKNEECNAAAPTGPGLDGQNVFILD